MIFTKSIRKKKEKESIVPLPEANRDTACRDNEEVITIPPSTIVLWKNPRAVKLISWLLGQNNARGQLPRADGLPQRGRL
jgi:hypothetical protein